MDWYNDNLRLVSSALLKGSANFHTTRYAYCKNIFKAVRSAFRMSSSLKCGNTLDTPSFSTRNFGSSDPCIYVALSQATSKHYIPVLVPLGELGTHIQN